MLRIIPRPLPLLIGLAAAALCVAASQEIVHRVQDARYSTPMDLGRYAADLFAQGRYDESLLLAEFVLDHPDSGDVNTAAGTLEASRQALASYRVVLASFAHGALTGEPRDTAGLLGSLSLDMFVIGDIRDLLVQGYRQARHGDGDGLILTLSAVGLAATAAPHLGWAPAIVKAAHRSGSLSPRFTRTLADADTKTLGAVMSDSKRALSAMGAAPFKTVLRNVDSADDLHRLSRAANTDRRATYAWLSARGPQGLRRVAADGSNITTLARSLKFGARGIKSVRKAWLAVPGNWLGLIALLSALAAVVFFRQALWSTQRSARA